MKVNFENGVKTELFCNIQAGECFVVDLNTTDQMICMKVWGCNNPQKHNAVDLQGGEIFSFDDDEEVIPIYSELKVRLGG